jgi:SpoVK/Ycf46/Vps4 family AAA+-type ATPase
MLFAESQSTYESNAIDVLNMLQIIFVDEIDALAPTRSQDSASSKASSRLVATLANELDQISGYPVMILGATNRKESIDESLRRPGRLDRELEIPVPAPSDRLQILVALLSSMSHGLSHEDMSYVAEMTHGFVGADLMSLCSEAAMIALRRLHTDATADRIVTMPDITKAMRSTRPSALREFSADVPHTAWSDVGGLSEVKQKLKEVVEWPIKYRDSLQRLGAVAPKGILLCGPPGCSKTLLARAVAGEANLNFFSIKGPELLSKFVGESEKSIANLFDKARKASPAILFFDEIDGLVCARSSDKPSTGVDVSERVLSQMLQEMDGIQGQADNLIVIAATNRPDRLDKALLRPGRFDRVVEVGLPSAKDREEIFQVHTRRIPVDSTVNLKDLADSTDGFSGADIAGLCQQAAMIALTSSAQQVGMADFTEALAARAKSSKTHDVDFSLYIRSV